MEGSIYDVEGTFAEEFRKYVHDQKLLCQCHYWNKYYDYGIWLFIHDQQPDCVDSNYHDFMKELIAGVKDCGWYYNEFLVQFWKAEELTGVDDFGEKRFKLTTRNQPFLITGSRYASSKVSEELCSYRMKMVDIVTGDRGGDGVIGRVYQSKRIESTPNIHFYSSEEYPQLDLALSCSIKYSLAIPISDSFGLLIGVLHVVCTNDVFFQNDLILKIQQRGGNLTFLDHCKDLCGQSDLESESFLIAMSEIKEVMDVVGRSCLFISAQTWILCNHCGSLSVVRKSLNSNIEVNYWFPYSVAFAEAKYFCPLKKGEGVVGKAATSSHNLVYCEDVSQFSITEYPLAHFARHSKVTACFAICLKSELTGSQMYVQEVFLFANPFKAEDPWARLVTILDLMKKKFKTFKLASGEEIGGTLSVQVIYARSLDKIVTLRNKELDLSLAIGTNNIESSTDGTNDPMTRHSMEETPFGSDSTVQSKCWVNIKVNQGGDVFSFRLPSSLGILDLSEQVSQSMNLKVGTYNFKYLDDDDDPILITCDDDLRQYISSSVRQDNYNLMMTIEPK